MIHRQNNSQQQYDGYKSVELLDIWIYWDTFAWQHRTIIRTNIDLLLVQSCGIHIKVSSYEHLWIQTSKVRVEIAFSKPYQDHPGPMIWVHSTTFRFLRHPHHCTDTINGWPSNLISSAFACSYVIHNTCKKYENLVQPYGNHCLIVTFLSCNHTLSNVFK